MITDPIETIEYRGYTIAIYVDDNALDPRREFDYWTEADYRHWRDGEVYGFVITPGGDSCWGHYGFGWCLQSAKESVDYDADHAEAKSEALDYAYGRIGR